MFFERTAVASATVPLAIAGVLLGTPSPAAAIECTELTNPVFFPATTLLESLLAEVAPVLADEAQVGEDQMTIVHVPLSSCISYDIHRQQMPLTGTGIYYLPDGTQETCDMPVVGDVLSDLSAMDVGGVTCLGGEQPAAELVEYPSHVETLGFVVPRNSTQTAITATEAYYLMKFGGEPEREVAPWTNPDFVFIRNPGSSTQLTIGANIGISGTQWNGALRGHQGSGDVRDAIIAENATGNAETVIGILNSSKWEAALNDLRVLAFQPFNNCFGAIFPDSTSTSRDKLNVRDGHYPIWTNLRYIVRTDAAGATVSANGDVAAARAQRFIDLMTGVDSIEALGVAEAVIGTGNIPTCAMHVAREVDGGPMASFDHPAPCDCFFLESNGVASGCAECSTDDECGEGSCRLGYCESR
ncbi:MAG: hypothetical protein K0V04_18650 [Deltaproteobacteria bacterium]|nr:hypothetical protein [Deltaproteobacteria bacterium]